MEKLYLLTNSCADKREETPMTPFAHYFLPLYSVTLHLRYQSRMIDEPSK